MQQTFKETVTRTSGAGNATVSQQSTTDTQTQTFASIIYFIAGATESLLLLRLLLKMTTANAATGFVSAIYGITQVLIAPFQGIFPTIATTGMERRAIFEPSVLVALIVYAMAAWGIVKLIAIASGHSNEEL